MLRPSAFCGARLRGLYFAFVDYNRNYEIFALSRAVLNDFQHLHKQPSKVDFPKGNYIASLNWRI